ncbi:hypothetical protein chiPu_0033947, partial [Chiloscyllium punctatum]|nr:hypothetical protein [Chiloscyllium punctatum]
SLFETIFEEPVQRDGLLVLTSQRRLKRAVDFQDCSVPRKRRSRSRLRASSRSGAPGACNRSLRSGMKGPHLELLLQQRLAELDALTVGEDSSLAT